MNTNLKAVSDKVKAEGIGLDLPVMQTLMTAIESHLATCDAPDFTQQSKAVALQTQVKELEAQLAEIKAAAEVQLAEMKASVEKVVDEPVPAIPEPEPAPAEPIEQAEPTIVIK